MNNPTPFTCLNPRYERTLRLLAMLGCITLAACASPTGMPPQLEESIQWYTGAAGTMDDPRAKALLEEAAATGNPLATMWMARVYSTGRMGFPADKARARDIAEQVITEIESLANTGNLEAAFLMGTAYAEGIGKAVEPVQAVSWYRRAAEAGHMLAQHNLGNSYFSGTGVPQDDVLAVYWWRLAAAEGDVVPLFRLGSMYEEGRGVDPDLDQALAWYREAASRNYPQAREALERLGYGD